MADVNRVTRRQVLTLGPVGLVFFSGCYSISRDSEVEGSNDTEFGYGGVPVDTEMQAVESDTSDGEDRNDRSSNQDDEPTGFIFASAGGGGASEYGWGYGEGGYGGP